MENQNNAQQAPQQNVAVQENIVDNTMKRIAEMQELGQITLPKNYSAPNALKAAWLILQDVKNRDNVPALTCCTRESTAYALLNMVVQGLNPIKRQCSFIVYGNKLTLQREYQGSIAIAKRAGLKDVTANAIFEGDVFKYEVDAETGRKKIIAHEQDFMNLGGKVVGAYAIVEKEDGTRNVEVMSFGQIQQAWQQGATKGNSPAHKNFPDQMACKTVIGRALKSIINSSDDAALFDDDAPVQDVVAADVQHKIETNSNKQEIGFDEHQVVDPKNAAASNLAAPVAQAPAQQEPVTEPETTGPGF